MPRTLSMTFPKLRFRIMRLSKETLFQEFDCAGKDKPGIMFLTLIILYADPEQTGISLPQLVSVMEWLWRDLVDPMATWNQCGVLHDRAEHEAWKGQCHSVKGDRPSSSSYCSNTSLFAGKLEWASGPRYCAT